MKLEYSKFYTADYFLLLYSTIPSVYLPQALTLPVAAHVPGMAGTHGFAKMLANKAMELDQPTKKERSFDVSLDFATAARTRTDAEYKAVLEEMANSAVHLQEKMMVEIVEPNLPFLVLQEGEVNCWVKIAVEDKFGFIVNRERIFFRQWRV